MKTILVTGIGGLTPRSIATIIRKNHPNYKIIGCDIDKKAMGFFMNGLVDEHYVCPRCTSPDYFPWIEKLVAEKKVCPDCGAEVKETTKFCPECGKKLK